MSEFSKPINNLIAELGKLPSIGKKTAQRLAFYIINLPLEDVQKLSNAILEARNKVGFCSVCCNISDSDPCHICSDKNRDNSIICVVEDSRSIAAMEKSGEYNAMYHVLNGTISPTNSVTPDMINITQLLTRIADDTVKEVILATNPTVDGEATAMYIARLIKPFDVKITRIARGLPMGSDIEYADEITIIKALEGRVDVFGK